eukprot:CAMPEP_0201511016 /NCGR_PEP_ID=MMETSP0161_2-20130828/3535_1 /ASSEMBLY_ACC=CAM_ASM_000251 /TAXON_ID=180227 /ORGANISM="Neoparamoeba aestuarina, Strain SoJaBio B1-5/56/2" /LENGTH=72 /DNA_ID=CAMNT_0047906343 /DNA_START=274 /DNA_END=489 /DNA_ORIENTATION=-
MSDGWSFGGLINDDSSTTTTTAGGVDVSKFRSDAVRERAMERQRARELERVDEEVGVNEEENEFRDYEFGTW